MANWLFIVISDDLPIVLRLCSSWEEARTLGNEFLADHDIPGKFLAEPPDEGDEGISVDSARFTGSAGIYNLDEQEPKDGD